MTKFKHNIVSAPIEEPKEINNCDDYIKNYIEGLENQISKLKKQEEEIEIIINSIKTVKDFNNALEQHKECIMNERRKLITKYTSKYLKPSTETDKQKEIRNKKQEECKKHIKFFDEYFRITQAQLSQVFERNLY